VGALDGDSVGTPDDRQLPLGLRIPGRASRADASIALAAAVELGVPVESAIDAIRRVSAVNGRYQVLRVGIAFASSNDVAHALSLLQPGAVDVVANYTSFRDITKELAYVR
jgi:UDP-N-acetylmuramyl tripeptide synthase